MIEKEKRAHASAFSILLYKKLTISLTNFVLSKVALSTTDGRDFTSYRVSLQIYKVDQVLKRHRTVAMCSAALAVLCTAGQAFSLKMV